MKLNYSVVIADTSCLILLDKIDELDILNALFEEVYITETIAKEFGKNFRFSDKLFFLLLKKAGEI